MRNVEFDQVPLCAFKTDIHRAEASQAEQGPRVLTSEVGGASLLFHDCINRRTWPFDAIWCIRPHLFPTGVHAPHLLAGPAYASVPGDAHEVV